MKPMFVLLTRLSPDAVQSPRSLEELEKKVMTRIREQCPDVEWVQNLAVLGPYDYLDVLRAPDQETAFRVATIIRSFGHAKTEVWGATDWSDYKELVRGLPSSG
ncbi:MAG: GYD domain-containing protein [Deltaproteobacteria bacterium]|nr:GYD domain-containing protein [Deltaproteobacteria bacterium]